ncbi:MAG TPA: hypothetical protein VD948_13275 [Rhodothermales bacterium]|nr:hypothetical protein [Rhodothermales bacterium]
MSKPFLPLVAVLSGLALAGCAPRLAPLYRDYRAPDSLAVARAERALVAAGWTLRTDAPAGTLATEIRGGSEFGLYRTLLSVEVLPLGGGLVRILFDPVRRFPWGDRTHIPYLPGGLSRAFVPSLDRALRAEGFTSTRTGEEGDRKRGG